MASAAAIGIAEVARALGVLAGATESPAELGRATLNLVSCRRAAT